MNKMITVKEFDCINEEQIKNSISNYNNEFQELINKYIMGESIVSFIYKFCRAVKIFNYLYGNDYKKIIDFAFGMITDISNFEIDNDILNKILNDPIFEFNGKFFLKTLTI